MMQENVAKVKNVMEYLMMLRSDVMCDKQIVSRKIEDAKGNLQAILDEEENCYVTTYAPGEDVVAIEDAQLNALFEAIAFLGEKVRYPKQIVKNIDNAVMKLKSCISN